jgi:hypothetical protein
MKFGDKKSFAVELEFDEDYGGVWLFGKFCYWVNGYQIGDYELGTSLRDVLSGMKWVVYDCGNRNGGILCESSPEEVFFILDNLLYGSEEFTKATDPHLPDTPAKFEITIPVDVFFQWKAFLIECGNEARVLFKGTDSEDIKVGTLPIGLFDNVIKEVYDYLDKSHERELSDETAT